MKKHNSKVVVAFYPPKGLGDGFDTDNFASGVYGASFEPGVEFDVYDICPAFSLNGMEKAIPKDLRQN